MKRKYLKRLFCSIVTHTTSIFEFDGLIYHILSESERIVQIKSYYNSISGDITIPPKVTTNGKTYTVISIGDRAFQNCASITSLTIPSSISEIGHEAFSGCTNLLAIFIPDSVQEIGEYAFEGCCQLSTIFIPHSVRIIGEYAFHECPLLEKINVDEQNPHYASNDGLLYTKDMTALLCCPGGKRSVTIPDTIRNIDRHAFEGCFNLLSITIPDSVISIDQHAFSGCDSLKSIYCQMPNPPSSSTPTFSDEALMNAILHVPPTSKKAYTQVDPWRNFWHIEEADTAPSAVGRGPKDGSQDG
jgi:hypothetical protein